MRLKRTASDTDSHERLPESPLGHARGGCLRSEPLLPGDEELIEAAKDVIGQRFELDRHHVGCALRTKSGRT